MLVPVGTQCIGTVGSSKLLFSAKEFLEQEKKLVSSALFITVLIVPILRFFDAVVVKEQHRPLLRIRQLVFDVERGEFLCPVCKRLSNTVLPVLPPLKDIQNHKFGLL